MPKIYVLYFVDKNDLHIPPKFKIKRCTVRIASESNHAVNNDTVGKIHDLSQVSQKVENAGIENKLSGDSSHHVNNGVDDDERKNVKETSEHMNIDKAVHRQISHVSMTEINPYCDALISISYDDTPKATNYELKDTKFINVQPAPNIFNSENTTEYPV